MKLLSFILTLAVTSSIGYSQDLNNGLAAHWKFDDGADESVTDAGPDHLDGVQVNAEWVKSSFGNALKLNPQDAYAKLPTPQCLKGASEATISIWVLWESTGQYPNILFAGWNPGGLMFFVSNNYCSFRLGRPNHRANVPGEQWRETACAFLSSIPMKKWVHLTAVFKRPAIKTYVDGKLVNTTTWNEVLAPNDSIIVGRWMSRSHDGLVSDLRIYNRALSDEEVAALTQATLHTDAAYTAQPKPPVETILHLENKHATLDVGGNGHLLSVKQKSPERELLAQTGPFIRITLKNGNVILPKRLTLENGLLVASHPLYNGTVKIKVEAKDEYFTFTPVEVTIPDVQKLTFCQVYPAMDKYQGNMAGLWSDDESGLGLRSLSLRVAHSITRSPRQISMSSEAQYGLTNGVSAAMAAGPRSALMSIYRAIEANEPVPKSEHGGVQALTSDRTRGSYLFANISSSNVDDWIRVAKRGGFSFLHFHGWWKTLGHYDINKSLFPNGLDDMKKAVDKIHDAGMLASFHTLTACIDPRDPWVSPVPSDDLISSATYTLARPFSETDTELYVNEKPVPGHEIVWSYSANGNAIKIGKEIIQYAEISREPPYAFKKCTRGAFGTKVSAHAQGDKADYLQQRYIAFYPDPDSQLAEDLADAIANAYNATGMDGIYFDGSEGMRSRYGIDTMRWKIYQKLKRPAVTEASCWGHNSWWFHSRLGAWDHPRYASRRNHDAHVALAQNFRKADLVQPQLGWWAPVGFSADNDAQFPDEMEYFAARNLGIDGPMSLQGIGTTRSPNNARVPEMMTILGWYERFRMARYFRQEDIEKLASLKSDFRLRMDFGGHWRLTDVTTFNHVVSSPKAVAETWNVQNDDNPAPTYFRIHALFSTPPLTEANPKPLADFSEIEKLTAKSTADGVTQQLLVEENDVKLAKKNLRIVAKSKRNTPKGAWSSVGFDYPHPYLSMGNNRAFGLWVKGDGSGALLNLQIQTPYVYHGAISDHYVDLDFTGWKYVELLLRERDAERMGDYEWPYTTAAGAHSVCRNVIYPSAISSIKLYLNNIPANGQVDVTVSPVIARPVVENELKDIALTIDGKTFKFPIALKSGHYIEAVENMLWDFRHYDERGELIEYIKMDEMPQNGMVVLNHGQNPVSFHATSTDGATSARAKITLVGGYGKKLFGKRSENVDWSYLKDEYELPVTLFGKDGVRNWCIIQRDEGGASPNDNAKLEVELYVANAGSNNAIYNNANGSRMLDDCQTVDAYKESDFNKYAKYAFDSENQGTSKPGVTFQLKAVPGHADGTTALQFDARSARSDNAGWAAVGRHFEKPVDISDAKAIGFWLKGDASGALFKVQLRDVKGLWHDMYTRVSFTGWKFIEFKLNDVRLDLSKIDYILYYYNNLPAARTIDDASSEGTLVSCAVDDVKILLNSSKLVNPTFFVNGQKVVFPVTMSTGDVLTADDHQWTVVDTAGRKVASGIPETPLPPLKKGFNSASMSFAHADDENYKVVVNVIKHY